VRSVSPPSLDDGERTALLETRDVTVEFSAGRRRQSLTALDGVSINVQPGETVGLVGESGSGKSTLGRAILGLVPVQRGTIAFDGHDITNARRRERRALSRELQVVFQDPYGSLNPAKRIGATLVEPLRVHQRLTRADAMEKVRAMLEMVGLPESAADRFPSQFSGGQRQRIAIARALMVSPRLVICDEPVSALDLSIQAQILNLFAEIQRTLGLSYLFIAHDLAVVYYLCRRIVVIYRGQIMEQGTADEVYYTPAHPYTQALLKSSPLPDPTAQRARQSAIDRVAPTLLRAQGQVRGCPFSARCEHVIDICRAERPPLYANRSACHRYPEVSITERRVV
jgi:oligopeptide/dipeptide ABC transporter ATP-binding protein